MTLRSLLWILLSASLAGAACSPPGCAVEVKPGAATSGTPPGGKTMGINVEQPSDWRASQMFADVIKQGRPWGSLETPWDRSAAVDENGWPTGDAAIVLLTKVPHMDGRYALSFRGQATVTAVGQAPEGSVRIENLVHDATTDTTRADVVIEPGGSSLMLAFHGQAGGVKNVRLMRPGHAPGETFSHDFLARLRHFPVLRSMDITATNGNTQTRWSDRVPPSYATLSQGAAWEHVIELANTTGIDPWITIPYGADDDYIRQLARLFHAQLDAERVLYVEHSNELWNAIFPQARANAADARAEVDAGDPHRLAHDGEDDARVLAWRRTGWLAKRHADVFREVFGRDAMLTRVRPVLAAHIANLDSLREPLEYLRAVHGDPRGMLYGVAAAPYIPLREDREGLDVDAVIEQLNAGFDRFVGPSIDAFGEVARGAGLRMLAYEGGQHVTGAASLQAKTAAQSDPRMGELMTRLFDRWYGAGGELFMFFTLCSVWGSEHGHWGLSDDIRSEDTPKWRAVLRVVEDAER